MSPGHLQRRQRCQKFGGPLKAEGSCNLQARKGKPAQRQRKLNDLGRPAPPRPNLHPASSLPEAQATIRETFARLQR